MRSKSAELQDQINEIDQLIQGGASDAQLNLWEMKKAELIRERDAAIAEEAQQQERLQTQEAEVESITLPYDFNEILSDGEFKVTTANDMIIEVVKDTKRQANIEKNQAIDELKAVYTEKSIQRENALQATIDSLQTIIENGTLANEQLTREIGDVRAYLHQVNLERDDAFAKRDAAFRQLQEAQDEIKSLSIKLENVPQAKQMDISASDKLANMVKESLDEKVKRGLARYADIIPVDEPKLEQVNLVTEVEAPAVEQPFPDQVQATDTGTDQAATGNESLEQMVGETKESQIEPMPHETVLAQLYQAHNELKANHEALVARVDNIERHANLSAVA